MFIHCEGQDDIVNLDRVSVIRKSGNSEDFSIDFFTFLSLEAGSSPSRIIQSNPTQTKIASWAFSDTKTRDSALQKILDSYGYKIL